jgi:2-amino-4-hydroxy-6-hydroxymethyldihydropteridine diphosphokinase
MNEVYLCLGGNLGNCLTTFKAVCGLLEQQVGKIAQQSSIYSSQAWGMNNAPDFFNQVLKLETDLSARGLMNVLLEIEHTLGRERTEGVAGYQNRLVDIDILFFNANIIKTDSLEIPHPRLHLRRFVLEPLNEIAPNYMHPVLHKPVNELLALCTDTGELKKLEHAL